MLIYRGFPIINYHANGYVIDLLFPIANKVCVGSL